jgi:hypothetical protein
MVNNKAVFSFKGDGIISLIGKCLKPNAIALLKGN